MTATADPIRAVGAREFHIGIKAKNAAEQDMPFANLTLAGVTFQHETEQVSLVGGETKRTPRPGQRVWLTREQLEGVAAHLASKRVQWVNSKKTKGKLKSVNATTGRGSRGYTPRAGDQTLDSWVYVLEVPLSADLYQQQKIPSVDETKILTPEGLDAVFSEDEPKTSKRASKK